jgi:hypothetical protein
MKHTLHLVTPLALSREGRISPRRSAMLDVCTALFLTLTGLLGREGVTHGE